MRAIWSAISLFVLVFFTLPLALIIGGYLLFTYPEQTIIGPMALVVLAVKVL